MEDVTEGHILDGAFEEYSLRELAESRVAAVKEHLPVCHLCRARLEGIEPVNFVHFTQDGPAYSRATRMTTGEVMARHWGKNWRADWARLLGILVAHSDDVDQVF